MTDTPANPNTENTDPGSAEPEPSEGKQLRLDQFLKLCGVAETGGQAKLLIQGGEILLNGEVETRRRKKLSISDVIQIDDVVLPVAEFFSVE